MLISLQPNVRLTSNQAVSLSLSVVLRSIKNRSIWTLEGPWRGFYRQGSPKISLAGSIWGSMKVQEGSLVHIIVLGYPKSCYQLLKGSMYGPLLEEGRALCVLTTPSPLLGIFPILVRFFNASPEQFSKNLGNRASF